MLNGGNDGPSLFGCAERNQNLIENDVIKDLEACSAKSSAESRARIACLFPIRKTPFDAYGSCLVEVARQPMSA